MGMGIMRVEIVVLEVIRCRMCIPAAIIGIRVGSIAKQRMAIIGRLV